MYIAKHIQALEGYTPGEQPADPAIVKLNTNENPYPPSPRVEAALAGFDYARLRLYPDPLFRALRERIGAIHGVGAEQVFVGNGSDEVLALCTRAFVEDNGEVGYFTPSYSLYPVLAEIRGARCKPVSLRADFGWRMDEGYSAELFFITNPNAPTSLAFAREMVAEFCCGFKGVVVVDEAYADFADGNCMGLATAEGNRNVLVLRTLSKSFSMAGIRLGYTVGPAELIAALYKIKDSYNLDMLTQVASLAALEDLEYMRGNVARICATRGRLIAVLRERGWQVCESQTNFVFARPPAGNAAEIFALLKQNKIYVRYFPGGVTGEYLRITVGTDAQIDRLLAVCP